MDLSEFVKATSLCDFDRVPQIRDKALELILEQTETKDKADVIFRYVKELPYGLEDWDVSASETLKKGWGMCSGKTNLLVAMLRSAGIPSRYRVIKIKSEVTLWNRIAGDDYELARKIGKPSAEQDHVMAEVYLNDWVVYDPSRDSSFENGLKKLDISLERKPSDTGDNPLILSSFDDWAFNRQRKRRFRENRLEIFAEINTGIEKIRIEGSL